MIKKIFIILFIAILSFSCGKKADPVYDKESKNLEVLNVQQITL